MQVAERADCVFCCLPHGASAAAVAELLPRGKKVIDLSADYRLNDAAEYQKWYGLEHADPGRLGKAVYGLPEIYRERIQTRRPGRQSRLLSDVGDPRACAAAASRRDPAARNHRRQQERRERRRPRAESRICIFPNATKASRPTASARIGTCRRSTRCSPTSPTARFASSSRRISFPMDRGILSTCYAEPTGEFDDKSLLDVIKKFYANEPFVRVTPTLPATKQVAGTNFCDITVRTRPRPRRRHQRDRQPRQRRLRRGRAELQSDARDSTKQPHLL